MALTSFEKAVLDSVIEAHMEEIEALEWFTLKQLASFIENEVSFSLAPISLKASLERIVELDTNKTLEERSENYSRCAKKRYYKIGGYEYEFNGNISKVRNILTIAKAIEDDVENFTYDFITETFNSSYKSAKGMRECDFNLIKKFAPYEWIFNYITDIADLSEFCRYDKEVYEKCPDGFIKYLNETETDFSASVLHEYYYKRKYGVVGYNLRNCLGCVVVNILEEAGLTKDFLKVIVKDAKNGMLNYSPSDFANYIVAAYKIKKDLTLDTNKSINANITMLKNIICKERNRAIEKQLRKINFVNGLESENLVVIVPQTQEEKREEGKMQNNCVGYYYDDSIINGENFIFFIRKKERVNHSYITCRYNTYHKRVIEARAVNNRGFSDSEADRLLDLVNRIITEHYSELAE